MSPADYHHPHLPPHLQYHFPPSSNNASPNGNSSFVSPRKRYLRDFDPTAGGTNGGGPSPAKHRRLSTDQSQQPPPRLNSIDQSQQRLGSTDSSLGGGGGSDRSSPYRSTATPASPYRPSPLSPHPMAASPRPPKSASGSAFSSFSIDSLMSQGGGPSSPRQGPASPSRPQAIKRETGTTLFVPVAVKREDNSNSNSLPSPHHSALRRDHETASSTFGSSPSRVVPSTSAHSPFLSSSRTPPPPSTPSFASIPGYPGYHPLLAAHQAAAAAALLDPRMAAQLAAAAAAYPFPGLFHHSPFAAAAAASPFHHLSSGGFGAGQPQPTPVVWTPPVATPTPPPPQRTPLKNEPPPPSPPKSGHALGTSYTASAAAPPVDFSRSREGADGRPTYGRPDMTAQCSRPQPTHQQVKTAAAASGSADGEIINF